MYPHFLKTMSLKVIKFLKLMNLPISRWNGQYFTEKN
jgi:hypothetical protein